MNSVKIYYSTIELHIKKKIRTMSCKIISSILMWLVIEFYQNCYHIDPYLMSGVVVPWILSEEAGGRSQFD